MSINTNFHALHVANCICELFTHYPFIKHPRSAWYEWAKTLLDPEDRKEGHMSVTPIPADILWVREVWKREKKGAWLRENSRNCLWKSCWNWPFERYSIEHSMGWGQVPPGPWKAWRTVQLRLTPSDLSSSVLLSIQTLYNYTACLS